MKTILFCFLTILLMACSRNNGSEETLNPSDAAVTGMSQESNNILEAIAHLQPATTADQIHHWV